VLCGGEKHNLTQTVKDDFDKNLGYFSEIPCPPARRLCGGPVRRALGGPLSCLFSGPARLSAVSVAGLSAVLLAGRSHACLVGLPAALMPV